MKKLIHLFIVGLVTAGLLVTIPAFAQDETASPTGNQAQQDDDESDEKEPAADEDEKTTSRKSRSSRLDEFIPTEEISEDNSVSFPVDI